jgi:hypothetical protein
MPPNLTDRILAAVTAGASISAADLRAQFPDVKPLVLIARVHKLLQEGRIETAGYGHYRAPTANKPRVAPPAATTPLSRLMGSR